jgi:probable nitrogen fixation protein
MAEIAELAVVEATLADASALATSFLQTLVRLLRAQDSYGAWEKKSDAEILKDYVITREQRRSLPIIGDPDPDVLWRVEQYYAAIGLCIEKETGLVASPMMSMHHEGFGRVILTAGRLVALSKQLRDVHRFGFDTLSALTAEGEKQVAAAAAMIRKYSEVANA